MVQVKKGKKVWQHLMDFAQQSVSGFVLSTLHPNAFRQLQIH